MENNAMDKLAFIYEDTFIYWNSILTVLAAVTAIGIFVCLYLIKSRNGLGAACMVPLALIASVAAARLIHWYCDQDSYESVNAAITDLTGGGYALAGVFAGCLFAAAFLRLLFIVRNLPELLDCVSLAGMAGIAVGSLTQTASGDLPVLFTAAAAIFAAGLLVYIIGKACRFLRDGETALLVLCAYGICSLVLGTHQPLYLPGIVSISLPQLLCYAAIALAIVYFCVRLVSFLLTLRGGEKTEAAAEAIVNEDAEINSNPAKDCE